MHLMRPCVSQVARGALFLAEVRLSEVLAPTAASPLTGVERSTD